MRKYSVVFVATILVLILAGCGDTFRNIKDAASGINSAADQAASAISQDVHSIRAIEITHNEQTFTVNNLFKSILRDVQWHYEKNESMGVLKVTGTWQPDLFETYSFSEGIKNNLVSDGHVTVYLTVDNHMIVEDKTEVTLTYKGELLVNEKGDDILYHLYEAYSD